MFIAPSVPGCPIPIPPGLPATKNSEIIVSSNGKRPLQGTRLFVRMAIRRSLGDPNAAENGSDGGITAEPHCHCQTLLAAGMAFFKRTVHIEGDARQIAEIL